MVETVERAAQIVAGTPASQAGVLEPKMSCKEFLNRCSARRSGIHDPTTV
jgi:hypothetical protein